jgi:hypothetical protein
MPLTINARDANSFLRSESQVATMQARAVSRARRYL